MDRIVDIANALGVDPCHIMGWVEDRCPESRHNVIYSVPKLDVDESDLLRKYRRLDDAAKGRIRNMLDYEYNSIPGNKANTAPKEA